MLNTAHRPWLSLTFAALVLMMLFACSGATAPADEGGGAPQLIKSAGDGQSATVHTAVPIPPAVVMRDASAQAIPGVPVTFAIVSGGGTIDGGQSTTDANGVARVGSWTLGTTAGVNTLSASAGELSVTFTASGTADAPDTMMLVAGDGQSASRGNVVPTAPTVHLVDRYGNPVPGVAVDFTVTEGGGSVTYGEAMTDDAGLATAGEWHVGSTAGRNTVVASAAQLTPLTVRAMAVQLDSIVQLVTPGSHRTCALAIDGIAFCWGMNDAGQAGNGSTVNQLAPAGVGGPQRFTMLTGGEQHTCGLTATGAAYCWGRNDLGMLGDGTSTQRLQPTRVVKDRTFTSLIASGFATCGVTDSGAIYCWGMLSPPSLVPGGHTFTMLVRGGDHMCGLDATGAAYCWGSNNFNGSGQLGDGTTIDRTEPTAVIGGLKFVTLGAGYIHTCGLTAEGKAYCWGDNSRYQIGDGTAINRHEPTAVNTTLTFKSIVGGNGHTCALTPAGKAYCWGLNSSGELGDGTLTSRTTPTPVSGDLTFTSISTFGMHTCGRTSDGRAYCWGDNTFGQLGDGSTTTRLTPTLVLP